VTSRDSLFGERFSPVGEKNEIGAHAFNGFRSESDVPLPWSKKE